MELAMTYIHARLANTALLFIGIMALWGFWRFFRRQGPNASYFGALAVGEILILVQGVLGAVLWFTSMRPGRGGIHILYGVISVLAIPGVYLFTKGREERRDMLIYAAVLAFLIGILLRAAQTGY
jgi:MFS superfamily sulfate permease-like transporter